MRILIVDDEPKMGVLLESRLEEEGHFARSVLSGAAALREIPNGYDLLITDLKMPKMSGLDLLKKVRENHPDVAVILMTAYASVETAIDAMKLGAEDYIVKPFPSGEMVRLVEKVDAERRMRREVEFRRRGEVDKQRIVGESDAIKRVLDMIEKVARTDATVLILGESGSGKELAARAIAEKSNRSGGPFVAINCATLSQNLLESELFGHEKGAFTGAHRAKPGRFELADGGTLFLDEIGELPGGIQAKLLRALEDGEINRVGGVNPIEVDIRLIAATNRDLQTAMEEGRFREDLYYRLAVFPIRMPPLSERREDIPLLVDYYFNQNHFEAGIDEEALSRLKKASWRGNVRELFNVLERAIILSGGKRIRSGHLPQLKMCNAEPAPEPGEMTLEEMERRALINALKKCGGNKTEAADMLGISRRMVYSRMKKLGVGDEDF